MDHDARRQGLARERASIDVLSGGRPDPGLDAVAAFAPLSPRTTGA